MNSQIIAHLREEDRQPQSLWEHLSETSEYARQFSRKIGLGDIGQILGLLHDLGKASKEFQRYLGSNTGWIAPDEDGYMEDAAGKKGKIDHSSAGAQVMYRYLNQRGVEDKVAAQILSLCAASHHSGLIDCLSPDGEDNFNKRIEKSDEKTHTNEALESLDHNEVEEFYTLLSKDIGKQVLSKLNSMKDPDDSKETLIFKYGLLARFLFSCLIDADRLSTIDFEHPGNAKIRNYGLYHPWETLIQRLDQKIKVLDSSQKTPVNMLRTQVSEACFSASKGMKGIYQLTVPTGGGKTLASLRFALHHAAHHKMDHVFYVIPFTSIIDQNAQQIREILEDRDKDGRFMDRVILEHHSNLTPEEETRRQSLLSENWDAPIVFTTQVQFLETLFGGSTRSARRMHQLANAVIIFDEVQTIPIRCVHMFNVALRFLVYGCGATVVLCTATQPLLDKVDSVHHALKICPEQKIIANEKELFNALKRYQVFDRRKVGGWNDNEVADLLVQELNGSGSVLVIVNTKKSAQSLYQVIEARKIAPVYHLSTNMCPAHRLEILSKIKEMLKNKQPVICVSTQLIEAGVDIDFGSVIRYLAGLDSITQAAGRCNREGLRAIGNIWIVNPEDENIDRLVDIVKGKEMAERVLDEFSDCPVAFDDNPLGLMAMENYYQYYFYQRKDEMNYLVGASSAVGREDNLFNLLSTNSISVAKHQRIHNAAPTSTLRQSFQTAAKAFHVIDSPTRGVIVPYGEVGKQIIAELCSAYEIGKQYKLLKKAQRYSVNLLPHEFKKMVEKGAIHEAQEGSGIFYMDNQYYHCCFGWSDKAVNDMEVLIV